MTAKQIHLAAHFPGVNNTTVWSDPAAGSHIEFSSFVHLAQTAERAKFDFFFLAEGLRLREQRGRIHDLDVVGRPDTFTVLAALAAVTDRLGLSGTINSTFNEPFEVARQFASLDHLSGGRAAWNVVTSWDAFTGENFRRGGFLARRSATQRASEFLQTATGSCGTPGPTTPSWPTRRRGRFLRGRRARGASSTTGRSSTSPASSRAPAAPGSPGHLPGRRLRRRPGVRRRRRPTAIFSRHGTLEAGQRFYARRQGPPGPLRAGPDELKILPAATFVLGDTDAEAEEQAAVVRRQQVSGPTAIFFLEQVWNRDLSAYDPDGPLPDDRPGPG